MRQVIDCRFSLVRRILSPAAVALGFLALGGLVFRGKQPDLVFWLFVLAGLALVIAEVHKRSLRVVIDREAIEDRHLFGGRRHFFKDVTLIRLYRDRRLWLHFSTTSKPVWVVNGMGDLRAVYDEVVARAREHGAAPRLDIKE